jgi:glucose-6-phosphate 1-dehydrogenase
MVSMYSSDALVLLGATGDLARRQILPALYGLLRHGRTLSLIPCVAYSPGGPEHPRAHAYDGIIRLGAGG